jgi:hypothetical protein
MGNELYVVLYRKLIDEVGTVFEFVMSWPAVSLRYYCTFGIGM